MYLNDLEGSWRVWTLEQATDWRWPPDVLLRQSEALIDDLIAISFASHRIQESQEST